MILELHCNSHTTSVFAIFLCSRFFVGRLLFLFDQIFNCVHLVFHHVGVHKSYSKSFQVKSVRIRSCSGPHFPAFGLNTEKYSVSTPNQSECGKIRTRIISGKIRTECGHFLHSASKRFTH